LFTQNYFTCSLSKGVSKGEQIESLPTPVALLKLSSVNVQNSLRNMAPRLPLSKLEMVQNMISSKSLTTSQMAKAAECSKRSIINISNNLRRFGNVRAPPARVGRRRSITPPMIEALCDRLLEKPGLYVTNSSLKRALASVNWSKKVARQRAKEQNADLRDSYLHYLSDFKSYHLVYVDESGCDKRIGFRRTGWSPLGTAPLQVAKFHRDQRYQILPAHSGVDIQAQNSMTRPAI
ncbi:hypothetical protein N7517_008212, partial [Penicillium concentricum]